MMKFAPPEIAAATSKCTECGSIYKVPLRKNFAHPLKPVFPLDFHPTTNNKFWQLQMVEVDCPECRQKTELQLPTVAKRGEVPLFGDDSHRTTAIGTAYCLSLVGGSRPLVDKICQELWSIKSKYETERPPQSWKLHMKDLHSGSNRARHHIFNTWSKSKTKDLISDLFDLIQRSSSEVFTFNVSFFRGDSVSLDEVKRDCYIALVADVIHRFTSKGFSPLIHFDSEKEFKGAGPIIHEWASRVFNASQRDLIYSYLSYGLPVPEPVFIEPASHPCLELADFIGFVIARGHYCQMTGTDSEYATERLGPVYYSWLRKDGNYASNRLIGFPWAEIYEK